MPLKKNHHRPDPANTPETRNAAEALSPTLAYQSHPGKDSSKR